MEYKLHRVARNSEGWVRPSAGRLGANDVGSYIKQRGFGHEDWNFNYSFASKGEMLGYTVARPSAKLADQMFGVILATYEPAGWKVVGYYNGARFKPQTGRLPDAAFEQMAVDVFELAELDFVSAEYHSKTLSEIQRTLREELLHHCWIIPEDCAVALKEPVIIPARIFDPGKQRMVTSFNISERQFDHITNIGERVTDKVDELEQEEGRRILKLHESIERKPSLVSAFRQGLISFAWYSLQLRFRDRIRGNRQRIYRVPSPPPRG